MTAHLHTAGRLAPRFVGPNLLPRFSLEPRDYRENSFMDGEQVVISENVPGTPVGFAWLPAYRAIPGASRLYAFTPSEEDACEALEVAPANAGNSLVDAAYALKMDMQLPVLADWLDESSGSVFVLGVFASGDPRQFHVMKMGVTGPKGDWLMTYPVASGHAQKLGWPLLRQLYQGPFSDSLVMQAIAPSARKSPNGVRIERRWGQLRHESGYVGYPAKNPFYVGDCQ